jgi:hypothetical protein
MTNTLSGWKTTTTTLLMTALPLQDYDSSLALVESYLSDVGGWVSTDITNAVGVGAPANGATTDSASATIVTAQTDKIHHLSATVTVDLTLDMVANLIAGQTDVNVIAQMNTLITNFITTQLAPTAISLSTVTTVAGTVTASGTITTVQRIAIDELITTGSFNHDPRAVAVSEARRIYALGTTWSLASYYSETDKEIIATVQKYTDITLSTIDTTGGFNYVISINPDSYTMIGGTKLTVAA